MRILACHNSSHGSHHIEPQTIEGKLMLPTEYVEITVSSREPVVWGSGVRLQGLEYLKRDLLVSEHNPHIMPNASPRKPLAILPFPLGF